MNELNRLGHQKRGPQQSYMFYVPSQEEQREQDIVWQKAQKMLMHGAKLGDVLYFCHKRYKAIFVVHNEKKAMKMDWYDKYVSRHEWDKRKRS